MSSSWSIYSSSDVRGYEGKSFIIVVTIGDNDDNDESTRNILGIRLYYHCEVTVLTIKVNNYNVYILFVNSQIILEDTIDIYLYSWVVYVQVRKHFLYVWISCLGN
jgi:hypothetical protein